MNIKMLTPAERSALTALARSPGWGLLVEKLFLPQVQLATRFLDRPAAEQSRADWLRGVKAAYMNVIDIVYDVAGVTNPFTRHAAGLVEDIRQAWRTSEMESGAENETHDVRKKEEKREVSQRARSGFPV